MLPVDETEAAIEAVKQAAREVYGQRLDRIILYGSHARGEADGASDIDLMLVLDGPVDPFLEIDRLSEPIYDIELDHGVLFGIVPVSLEAYRTRSSPLIRNAQRDGVPA